MGSSCVLSKHPVVLGDSGAVYDSHISLLQDHLPKSFALLRRLQFARNPAGRSQTSHVLVATCSVAEGECHGGHFAAAYVDIYGTPETQVWIYSSLEDSLPDGNGDDAELPAGPDVETCVEQVLTVLRRIRELSRDAAAEGDGTWMPVGVDGAGRHDGFMVGALHETLRRLLVARGVVTPYCNPHHKWLFRIEHLPKDSLLHPPLTPDMRWDVVRKEDVPLIISSTKIPKTESTLMKLPSLGIRLSDGTLIAWSFLGLDGTLSTLHCEEPFRRRGLAKALAAKLIQDHNGDFGSDGWCAADVHIHNSQSQCVCKKIGGKRGWRVSWSVIANSSL